MFYFIFGVVTLYTVFTFWFAVSSFKEGASRAGVMGFALSVLMAFLLALYAWAYAAGLLDGSTSSIIQQVIGVALALFSLLLFLPLGRRPQALLGTKGMKDGESKRFNQKDTAFSVAHVGGYGPEAARNRWALQSQDPFAGLFWTLVMALRYQVEGKVNPKKTEGLSVEAMTESVKKRAKYLGADLVGVTTVKEDFTYSDGFSYEESKLEKGPAVTTPVDLKHKYLVVLGREMSHPVIKNALTDTENAGLGEIGKSYHDVALVACTLAAHIRTLGYSARAHHLRNDQIMHVPHAVDAGLGEQGRGSYLMTARYGPRVRLAAVSTNMELALDKPVDIGVQDFCEHCRLCEMNCPCNALPAEKTTVRGYKRWLQDQNKCFNFWVSGANTFGCTLCLNSCPWNKPRSFVHKVSFFAATRSVVARRFLYLMTLVFYGKRLRWKRVPLTGEVELPPEAKAWNKEAASSRR